MKKIKNYATHFCIGLCIVLFWYLVFEHWPSAFALAVVWAWKQEAGEQSVRHHWYNRSTWTDHNPFSSNWSTDDRLDFASTVSGASAALILIAAL